MMAQVIRVWGMGIIAGAFVVRGAPAPAPPAPAGFDCKTRHLAMEFARKIQPFRSGSDFKILAETLDQPGGLPGGATQCFNVTYDGPNQTFTPTFSVPSAGPVFFADVAHGSDATGTGTMTAPFASIEKALATCRAAKSGEGCTIALRAGVYYASDTLKLTPADSGLTVMNYNGEEVWLSGAKALTGTWAHGGADHPSGASAIWKLSLKGQGVKEITGLRIGQKRAVRARYPNGCTTDQPLPSGYVCQGNMTDGRVVDPNDGFGSDLLTEWVVPTPPGMSQPNWQEVNPDTPFRGTGLSFQKFQLGIGGTCGNDTMSGGVGFVPPAGYWCGNACEGGAPKPPGCIARWPRGLYYNTSILPNAPYKNPTTGVVQAWHPGHWASWMFEIVPKNDKGETGPTQLMFGRGGFQGARGSYGDSGLPPGTHGRMADSFFIENVFEELDADNEFFYDADAEVLYYFSSAGPPTGLVEATFLQTFISMEGTQAEPIRRVSLLGVNFRDTALSYLDDHSMPSGGDWGLGRIAAVFVKGAVGTTIDSCTMERLDGNAIMINGYARSTTIQNCNFHEIGDNIIAQLGETEGAGDIAWGMGPDGTAGNQPVGTVVKNNFAYRCGLFEKQSSFYFQAKSRGSVIDSNIFFHGPRAGMNFNDGFGGGSRVSSNLMFSTVIESGDHGPFNSWDRQVWEWLDDTGARTVLKEYDEITGNFFIGNWYGQEAIDNDDGSAYYETHHNYFVYARQGMKNDFNGHDNHHHDNLYGFIGSGLGICGALPGHADRFYNNKVVQLTSAAYARFDCSCSKNSSCPDLHDNMVFTPDGTMGQICGQSLKQRQDAGLDPGTVVLKTPSDEEIIGWARELLELPASL